MDGSHDKGHGAPNPPKPAAAGKSAKPLIPPKPHALVAESSTSNTMHGGPPKADSISKPRLMLAPLGREVLLLDDQDSDGHIPQPWEILVTTDGFNLVKWMEVKASLKLHYQADQHMDVHSVFPTKTRSLHAHVELAISALDNVNHWILQFAEHLDDMTGNWKDFKARLDGRSAARGGVMMHIIPVELYNFSQNDANAIMTELCRIYEKVPPSPLVYLSRDTKETIFRHALIQALPGRTGIIQSNDICLDWSSSYVEVDAKDQSRKQAVITFDWCVLDTTGLTISRAGHKSMTRQLSLDPLDISGHLIPHPHPLFSIPIAPTLAKWLPTGDPNLMEPTREQLDRGISLMMHIASEAGLRAETSYQAGRICEDIVTRYSLKNAQAPPYATPLYQGLPLWRTESLKGEGLKGATKVILPSREVEKDVFGTLPKIPVSTQKQITKVTEAIEEVWVRSQSFEDAWQAGCRAWDTLEIIGMKR